MTECEFLSVCNSEGGGFGCPFTPWTKESEDMMTEAVRNCTHRISYLHYLNSPQFREKYFEREKAVEEIEKRVWDDPYIIARKCIGIIRTVGKDSP